MEKSNAVAALSALAQDNRLDVFRLLVQAGPEGMAAGAVAEALDLAPNTLTFHFDRLRMAGLVTVRRDERASGLSDRELLPRPRMRAHQAPHRLGVAPEGEGRVRLSGTHPCPRF
jgi:DNA-binding transcriptional ArsR family regulator